MILSTFQPFNLSTFQLLTSQPLNISLHTGNSALVNFIRECIRARGPVPFAWFMQEALYHPEHGYYSADRCALGRRGDYFTNISVGPLFGRMLAAQFGEIWELLERPEDFVIVEQGAHHGEFAWDVLGAVREERPEFFAALRYRIIEPFPILRQRQAGVLRWFAEKIEWQASLAEMAPFCGVHFCNELLDAMPVHLLRAAGDADEREWQERLVERTSSGFTFVDRPVADASMQAHLAKIPPAPAGDYETEINLAALDWIETLARKLIRGLILTVDYGYVRPEFYAPQRTTGTLQCYAKHRLRPSPLEGVGETDITAHVEWTSLAERAEESGLTIAGFADQHHFLTGLLATDSSLEATATAHGRSLQTLLHPEMLGTRFQYLALTKDFSPGHELIGFKFADDPHRRLSLERAED